jgi:hypothetical protein
MAIVLIATDGLLMMCKGVEESNRDQRAPARSASKDLGAHCIKSFKLLC